MLRVLSLGDILAIIIPFSPLLTNLSLSENLMVSGRSPFVIMHWMALLSPEFAASSPKENGRTIGATEYNKELLTLVH